MYHYTSEAGFSGILQSREIWLSDLQASNDPRDLQMGLNTLKVISEEIAEKEYSAENARVLTAMTAKMIRYFENARCYTACFTPHADSLNMWREYGSGGEGFSIGFRPRAITDMHGRIYKVRYVDDASHEDLYNLISEVVKPIEIYGQDIFKDPEKEIEISTALISIVNSLKHFSWDYENETRLTYASGNEPPPDNIPVSLSLNGKERHWTKCKTRQSGQNTIRYHSFPFGKFTAEKNDPREAIHEVIIGPKAALTEGDVRKVLLDCGFSGFLIKKSACAFR